jgi:hypothetical protein
MENKQYLAKSRQQLESFLTQVIGEIPEAIKKHPKFVNIWTQILSAYDDSQPMIDIVVESGKIFGFIKILVEARSMPDKLLQYKVKKFFKSFPNLSEKDILQFIKDYEDNSQKTQKLGESLLLLLDKFESLKKAELLGLLFIAKCKLEIDEEEYNTFTHALCNIDIKNIKILKKYHYDSDYNAKLKKEYHPKVENLSEKLKTVDDDLQRKKLERQKESLSKELDSRKADIDSEEYRRFLNGFANVGLLDISSVSIGLIFAPPYYPNKLGRTFVRIANPIL